MEAIARSVVPALVGAGIILVLALLMGGNLRGRKAQAGGRCEGCSCGGSCDKNPPTPREG